MAITARGGGDVRYTITADDRTQAALSKARKRLGRAAKDMRRMGNIAGGVAAAGTAALSVKTLQLVKRSADAAREMQNLANVADTNAERMQKMAFASRTVGVDQEKLADIMKDTQDRVGDFITAGSGPMVDFFEKVAPKVGVTAQEFRKLSGPDALQLYVDSLEKANLSQSEMTFYMEALSGDAAKLLPLLRDGGAAMQEQARRAEQLGVALTNVETQKLTMLSNEMNQAQETAGSFIDKFSAEFAPVISATIDYFENLAIEAGGFGEVAGNVSDRVVDGLLFIADGAAGAKRTFEVLGKSATAAVLSAEVKFWQLSDALINGPVWATNQFIGLLNKIPGVEIDDMGFSDLGNEIHQNLQTSQKALEIAKNDIHQTLMEPLPSSALRPMIDDAREQMNQAAEKMAREQEEKRRNNRGRDSGNRGESPEQKGNRERMERELQQIEQFNQTKLEKERQAFSRRQQMIAEAEQNGMIGQQRRRELEQQLFKQHQTKLAQIETKELTKRQKFEQASMQTRVSMVAGDLQKMTQAVAGENRKMFEINKMASIAMATVEAIKGAETTWNAYPYPWNIPMTAAHVAASAARLSQLKSQSFGGGGTAPSATSAGSGAPAGSQPVNDTGGSSAINKQKRERKQQEGMSTTIVLPEGGMSNNSTIRDMLERMDKVAKDTPLKNIRVVDGAA